MQIIHSFEQLPKNLAITIGTFDGLHLGHQAIFSKLRSYGAPTCTVTFIEHPLKTLSPEKAPLAITPLPLKLLLLKTDFCLLLDFREVKDLSYSEFLNRLFASHIILGKGSALGKNREGTESKLHPWNVEYIEKLPSISSTEIRNAILTGNLSYAEKLLGRPHLLLAPSQTFSGKDLVLPPDGVYPLSDNQCTIRNGVVSLRDPITKQTIFSFNPNEEFHV